MNQPRYFALLPAAGVGARMAVGTPKQYLPLGGKPMLRHALDAFEACAAIARTYIVVSAADDQIDAVVVGTNAALLRCGGATRMESVRNGLAAMAGELHDEDWVLVHDAARPGLNVALIEKLLAEVGDDAVGGLLALPVVDTVKRAARAALSTVPRDDLWLAQTPQMFRYGLLRRALDGAADPAAITDDASAIEALGLAPKLVQGHPCNLKVTLASDIDIAEMYLARAAQLKGHTA